MNITLDYLDQMERWLWVFDVHQMHKIPLDEIGGSRSMPYFKTWAGYNAKQRGMVCKIEMVPSLGYDCIKFIATPIEKAVNWTTPEKRKEAAYKRAGGEYKRVPWWDKGLWWD